MSDAIKKVLIRDNILSFFIFFSVATKMSRKVPEPAGSVINLPPGSLSVSQDPDPAGSVINWFSWIRKSDFRILGSGSERNITDQHCC